MKVLVSVMLWGGFAVPTGPLWIALAWVAGLTTVLVAAAFMLRAEPASPTMHNVIREVEAEAKATPISARLP
jgi:hypothetical protein